MASPSSDASPDPGSQQLAAVDFVKDPEASLFWRMNFHQADQVGWNQFSDAIQAHFGMQLNETEIVRLEAACRVGRLITLPSSPDPFSTSGLVTRSNFQIFLQLFGPFNACLDNCLLADTISPVTRDERIAHLKKKSKTRTTRSPHGSPDRGETLMGLHAAIDDAKRDAEAAWDRVRALEAGGHEQDEQLQDEIETLKLKFEEREQQVRALEAKVTDRDETIQELQDLNGVLENENTSLRAKLAEASTNEPTDCKAEVDAEARRWMALLEAEKQRSAQLEEEITNYQAQLEKERQTSQQAQAQSEAASIAAKERAELQAEREAALRSQAADLKEREQEMRKQRENGEREAAERARREAADREARARLKLDEEAKRKQEAADAAQKAAEERRRAAEEEEARRQAAEEQANALAAAEAAKAAKEKAEVEKQAKKQAKKGKAGESEVEKKARKAREKMDSWVLKTERKLKVIFDQVQKPGAAGWVPVEDLKRQRRSVLETLELKGKIKFGRVAEVFYIAEMLANDGEVDFGMFKQFAFDLHQVCNKFEEKKQAASTERAASNMGGDDDEIAQAFRMYDVDNSKLVILAEIYGQPEHFALAAHKSPSVVESMVQAARKKEKELDTGVLDFQGFSDLLHEVSSGSAPPMGRDNASTSPRRGELSSKAPNSPRRSDANSTSTTAATRTPPANTRTPPANTRTPPANTRTPPADKPAQAESSEKTSMIDRYTAAVPSSPRERPSKGFIRDRADSAGGSNSADAMLDRFTAKPSLSPRSKR